MKPQNFRFIANVIGQLNKVPERALTQEYVATLFADRLQANYSRFDRTQFLKETGVTPRMVEEVEESVLV